jgi:DNA-binding HxlR family transcriptional regulator
MAPGYRDDDRFDERTKTGRVRRVPLPNDYAGQNCSAARTLEVIGERWTLLIVRDAFYGVKRFGDFAAHLDIPRAVLTSRLNSLVQEGVLERVPGPGAREEYGLTDKGTKLWPVVRDLMAWGDEFYSDRGPRRVFRHTDDNGVLDASGRCQTCGAQVGVADTVVVPGPGHEPSVHDGGMIDAAFARPRRLLQPIRG